jgi:hypothetical protein
MSRLADGHEYIPGPSESNLLGLLFGSADGTLPCARVTARRTRVGHDPVDSDHTRTFDRDTIAEVIAYGMVIQDGSTLRITEAGVAHERALREQLASSAAAREERRLARRRGRCTLCGGTWPGRTDNEARTGHADHMKTVHHKETSAP